MNLDNQRTHTNDHGLSAMLRDVTNEAAERAQRFAAGAEQRRFDEAARLLSDELFNGDPLVNSLTQDAEAKAERWQRLQRGAGRRDSVSGAMALMRDQLSEAQQEMRLAAIDDALDGDYSFQRAAVVALRVNEVRCKLESAMLAQETLAMSPPELVEFSEVAKTAQRALRTVLLDLKKEHLRAHPELLEASAKADL